MSDFYTPPPSAYQAVEPYLKPGAIATRAFNEACRRAVAAQVNTLLAELRDIADGMHDDRGDAASSVAGTEQAIVHLREHGVRLTSG